MTIPHPLKTTHPAPRHDGSPCESTPLLNVIAEELAPLVGRRPGELLPAAQRLLQDVFRSIEQGEAPTECYKLSA